ncbi:aldo/keto reductase [Aureimonas frigidaquae]|uniref:2,5-diketo-D-gluconic acid reductase A n=1 Tax=Aureimonas frigidaquae TaxID=424757 RepID=A0A0P0Z0U6_9HYPH|nr:aldo/keto reductase [Aureimonas frigidaquae]BAT27291.1 2,5-diketo-D-gluconic acid reductase A [Aureimonas frigidaquae]
MTSQPYLTMNDGRTIPQLGLGVFKAEDSDAQAAVRTAIETGYRHVDTAAIYGNEAGVGRGVADSGIARDDLFITTKLWNEAQGFDSTLRAAEESLGKLGMDYVDLYLIHWPSPRRDLYVETWRALIRLREEGRVRSIGVSNFTAEHLDRIISETGVTPVLNQIELHPRFQQAALSEANRERDVLTQAWSPLGQGRLLEDAVLTEIAARHGRSPAQVILRWHLQKGFVVIPKSVTPQRIRDNFDVFDFELSQEDMAAVGGLDKADGRIGPDPMKADF